ncbi:hypothetical protein EQ826_19820 [Ectopseudomonas mendocina]|nr:hypothetical protein [Pseudomonas mendocina]TRO15861.1 hypothetical protein EQ828_20160 [Pseudomonas mendocina]TRO23045.1 hypothetical protein EQ826_19820 [Pseudomonas mendocina]
MMVTKPGIALSRFDFSFSVLLPFFIYTFVIAEGRGVFVYPEITFSLVCSLVFMTFLVLVLLPTVSVIFVGGFRFVYRVFPRVRPLGFLVFSVVYFVFSIFYFLGDLNYIRYGGAASEQLKETFIATAIFLCKIVVCTQVFYMLLMGLGRGVYSDSYWFIVSMSMILSTDGMAHVVLLGVFFWFLLARRSLDNFLYSGFFYRPRAKFFFGLGVLLLFFVGIAFKAKSINVAAEILNSGELIVVNLLWLADRVSTLYFSVGYAINNSDFNFSLQFESWNIIVSEIKYRVCVLFSGAGCSVYRELYGSMSRFNFANISFVDPGRGGASPGVLGSASYLFPIYIAPFFAVLYYALVSAAINAAVGAFQIKAVKIFGAIVLIYLVRIVYLNPASMLNPISSPFIGVIVFLAVSAQFYKLKGVSKPHE